MAVLKLTGTAGAVKGFAFMLAQGSEASIGRSRGCGVSLFALEASGPGRSATPQGRAFRGISRRHAVIRFRKPRDVEILDQSRHGTFVDGERIETVVLTDLEARPHTLRLGKADTFRVELVQA